jgi:small redox-active disulfide protein 1
MSVKLEVFTSPTCPYCPMVVDLVERLKKDMDIEIVYEDIMKDRKKAVELGLMAVPAITINGKIKFIGVPEEKELREEIKRVL